MEDNTIVWLSVLRHRTYPGFCRAICHQYGLLTAAEMDRRRVLHELDVGVFEAESFFTTKQKHIRDKCHKDEFNLLKYKSLREMYETAWYKHRYLDDVPVAKTKKVESDMTVSLYKSTASGVHDVVVQTNAQNLDVFVPSFASALAEALELTDDKRDIVVSALKNAFPIAFALAGYKAEKVSESRLLTCGFASPDSSELLAQSAV